MAACALGWVGAPTIAAAAGEPTERDRHRGTSAADAARNPVLAIVRQLAEEAAAAAASASAGPAVSRPIAAVSIGASTSGSGVSPVSSVSSAPAASGRTAVERILP